MWLLDLGNTRLKLARADADGVGAVHALAHAAADFDARLGECLARSSRSGADARAVLASVAPSGVRLRVQAALEAAGLVVDLVQTQAECAGLRIAYADPARLGVDRFLGLLAARRRGGDWLVASFGSAVTVDLLPADGRHAGGLIGIAPEHAAEALRERFPALSRGTALGSPRWAADTPEAVAAGTRRQAIGLVLAGWQDAIDTLGRPPGLLLGGGDAPALADEIERRLGVVPVVEEALVIEGLHAFAEARAG